MSDHKFIAPEAMVRAIGPVTRGELDTLREQRETPSRQLEYTIGGATEEIVRRFEQERRTVRESYIESRLTRAEGRAANDFALGTTRGSASRDFGRER